MKRTVAAGDGSVAATGDGQASSEPMAIAVHGRTTAYILLAGAALVWGCHWVVVKVALDSMPPFTFGLLRVSTGVAVAFVFLRLRGQLRFPDRADLPIVVSVGLGQVAVGVIFMNLALQVMPAGRSAVLAYTMPLWVAIIHALVFRFRPTAAEGLGTLLGLTGLAVLLNPTALDWGNGGEAAGAGLLLLSAICWAVITIHVRRHHWRDSPLALQPWQLLVALVPLAFAAPVLEPGLPVRWELGTFLILAYSGPLATVFTIWASQSITRSLGPQAATTGFLAVPMVGLAAGALLLGEPLTFSDLAGFALIVAGVVATTRGASGGTSPVR